MNGLAQRLAQHVAALVVIIMTVNSHHLQCCHSRSYHSHLSPGMWHSLDDNNAVDSTLVTQHLSLPHLNLSSGVVRVTFYESGSDHVT